MTFVAFEPTFFLEQSKSVREPTLHFGSFIAVMVQQDERNSLAQDAAAGGVLGALQNQFESRRDDRAYRQPEKCVAFPHTQPLSSFPHATVAIQMPGG